MPHSKENKEIASLLQIETKREVVFFFRNIRKRKWDNAAN